MGEIKQRHGSGEPPAGTSVDEAVEYWTCRIVASSVTAHREEVTRIVRETQQVTDEQIMMYVGPYVHESLQFLGDRLLGNQRRRVTELEQAAAEYFRRLNRV